VACSAKVNVPSEVSVRLLGNTFHVAPSVISDIAPGGQARVNATVNIHDSSFSPFKLLGLPANWSSGISGVLVTLVSPTANGSFQAGTNSLLIPRASFGVGPTYQATAPFPPMRPSTDYQTAVYLEDTASGPTLLSASAASSAITINAGANNLVYNVTINGQEGSYNYSRSFNNNVVADNYITKNDEVILSTGIATSQPGVNDVYVRLSGPCYSASPLLLKHFTSADINNWNTLDWNTAVATGTFVPANLIGGSLGAPATGVLDIQAYDVNAVLVGEASFTMGVYNPPTTEALTFVGQPPIINNFSPMTGSPGNVLTVNGNGFSTTPAANAVTIGGVPATVLSSAAMSMQVLVPTGVATGQVAVTVATQSGSSRRSFSPIPDGTVLGTFTLPVGASPFFIATDSKCNAWVANNGNNTITKLDSNCNPIVTASAAGGPYGVAVDGADNVWIGLNVSAQIQQFGPAGNALAGPFPVGAANPEVVAIHGGNIWTSCGVNGHMCELTPAGAQVGTSPWLIGNDLSEFGFDATGDVFVTDDGPSAVREMSPTGVLLGTYPVGSIPEGCVVDSANNVWSANNGGASVSKLLYPGYGSAGAPFPVPMVGSTPWQLAIDKAGNIWVALGDSTPGHVDKLSPAGAILAQYAVADKPVGLAVDAVGNIWVTTQNSAPAPTVSKLSP
jgi:streptogramin lyase